MIKKTKRKRVIFYTEEFKSKVVHEVLSGKLSKKQASDIYGISGGATVLYWIRQSQGLNGNIKPTKTLPNSDNNALTNFIAPNRIHRCTVYTHISLTNII